MSTTLVTVLAVLFAGLVAVGCFTGYSLRHRLPFTRILSSGSSAFRQLTPEERIAVERYLAQRDSNGPVVRTGYRLARTMQSNRVYPMTRAITRYSLTGESPNKARYYIDTQEVDLPPFWDKYITQDNNVEIIQTGATPLVVSLNGHSIIDYVNERPFARQSQASLSVPPASIHQTKTEDPVELVTIRKETPQEHAIYRSGRLKEAGLLCVSLLLLLISLNSPISLLPWLVGASLLLALWSGWQMLRRPSRRELREIHCLRGTPKCLGLFGESRQEQASNISLGNIDLIYPPHWQPWVSQDINKKTDVDIYLSQHVVRQGRWLSLHEEVKRFPLQRWGKNLVLAGGSLLMMIALLIYVPLGLPLKLSLAWLQGAQSIQVSQVDALENKTLSIGDTLQIQGTGMCYVPSGLHYPVSRTDYAFTPFDCSAIYWNKAEPLPLPESDIIEKTAALLKTVNEQLHPQIGDGDRVSSQLASAIQKSGMILLNDFSGLVLKTQDLCNRAEDCPRLKNALVNLGNAPDWDSLINRARSGTLNGMNVLLRPVSAENLEMLVNNATDFFFYQEINRSADLLNSPPPGGFLIRSDEGRQLVAHPAPPMPLHEYTAPQQWQELQRLSSLLLQTPFSATGVITQITTDANGTRHIDLHSEPDAITLWRHLGTCLLLLLLSIIFMVNVALLAIRWRKNRHRMADIHAWYAGHFASQSVIPRLLGAHIFSTGKGRSAK
ncbi:intracellular growth attenuator family protein [Affinibrenneria salicis]|uniref:Intracellular growth attenuator family protein n=1 Tax=Affinibrenneria salicis TaxID=2590031 RepID=A0A5J5FU01_9GAMM|nr:IgaA/UmoB family intracellular growth attenuator [Affinibrenneria salicis]KAA8996376.1 intracellular growth attenuator family protein [Affinibrenneria salicis]